MLLKIEHIKRLFIALLAIILIVSSITGFINLPQTFYYGSLFLFGLFIITSINGSKIGLVFLVLFLIICAFSIIINQPPSYFRAWPRYIGFTLIVMIVGPIFMNAQLYELRRFFLSSIMWVCVLLSIGSFICFFLDINYFVRDDEVLAIEAGHFSGLLRHSMLLGPIAGLSAIYVLVDYLGVRNKLNWKLFIIICCIGSNLLAASRGAVGACVLGFVVTFMCYYRKQMSRGLIIVISIICILAATYSLWGGLTDFVITKQDNNIEAGGTFISRDDIWLMRISEIQEHPLTGVGFSCVDAGISYVDTKSGVIEPGSSWLAVFSMTGVFGFICFLLVFLKSFQTAFNLDNRAESSLLCGFLSFFAIHLVIEGYVLASGSFLGVLFWLLLGCIYKGERR